MSVTDKGKHFFNFFFHQKPTWDLNPSKHCDMFTFGGEWCGGGGGSIINAREDYLGTALSCWETQHLKSPGGTPVQEKRCCHVDELWLVGKQVQERSLQITLSLNLVLRKTKAASGISAKKEWKCSYREGGSWGRWELWNAFISILWSTTAYWSTSVKISRDGFWHKCVFWIS